MEKLKNLINKLEETALVFDKINTNVSKSNVGWHIEHSLKVIIQIADTLEKSNPAEYKWSFNTWRIIVLTFKNIPRGKGKAPNTVIPAGDINSDSLKKSIEQARIAVNKIVLLKPDKYITHPYFGDLNLKSTSVFLQIHTNHHLKIIKDIIKDSV